MKIIYYFLFVIAFMLSACSSEEPMTLVATGSVEKIYRDVNSKEKTVVDIRKENGKTESFVTFPKDISTIYDIEERNNAYVYRTQSDDYLLSSLEMTPSRIAQYWNVKNDQKTAAIGLATIFVIFIIIIVLLLSFGWKCTLLIERQKRKIRNLKERLGERYQEDEE